MSRCRCSDITNTENQITQLENAQTILSGYAGRKESRDNNLSRCSSSAQQATGSAKVAAEAAAAAAALAAQRARL